MYEFVKKGAFMLLVASLAMSMASCDDDDPDYSDVTPPEVAVAHSISGRVTGIDGEGLSATVSMNGTSATTQTDGTFVFENVAAGTYTLKAEADGKVSKETSITVSHGDSNNPVWNVTLSNEGTTITANADGSANVDVTSEVLKGNEEGKIEMTLSAPAGAVNAGTQITITPIYSTDEVEQAALRSVSTKAAGSTLLIGTRISSSNASATLQQPVTLEYDVDPEIAGTVTAQKYVNGTWGDAEYTVEGGKVMWQTSLPPTHCCAAQRSVHRQLRKPSVSLLTLGITCTEVTIWLSHRLLTPIRSVRRSVLPEPTKSQPT